jgi:hypothetical protein
MPSRPTSLHRDKLAISVRAKLLIATNAFSCKSLELNVRPTRVYLGIAVSIIVAGVLVSASLFAAIEYAQKATYTVTSFSTATSTSTLTIVSFVTTTGASESVSSASSSPAIDSPSALQLRLFVGNSFLVGQPNSVQVNLTEYNTAKDHNNLSASDGWPEDYLSTGGLCGQGRFPFGVAVYQGNYTSEDIASATPLAIFASNGNVNSSSDAPRAACPAIPQVSYYDFFPSSDDANVTVVCGPACTIPATYSPEVLTLSFSITGYWDSSSNFTGFGKGTYTVLAGDEWGHTSIQYFSMPTETF